MNSLNLMINLGNKSYDIRFELANALVVLGPTAEDGEIKLANTLVVLSSTAEGGEIELMALQDSVDKTNKMLKEQKKEDVKKLTDGVVKIKLDVVSGKENCGSHNTSGKAKKITKKKSLKGSDKRESKASKIQRETMGSTSKSFRPLLEADVNVVKASRAQKPSASQGKPIKRNKQAKILSSKNINQKMASSYNKHTGEDQGVSQKVTVCSSKKTLYQPSDLGKTRHFYYSLSITKTTKKDQLDKYNLDDTSTDSSTDSDGSESVTSTSSATSPGSTDDSVHTTSTSRSSIDSSEDESLASGCRDERCDSSDDSEEHSFTSSSTSSEEDKRVVSSSKLNSVKKLENTKYKK
uniref:Uncharacterized protein n=1 Tax=Timema monikensis TaxID=170555 RepID=A0A7R9DYI1_9NEOP|nr:unnamed protein product [Timema monikensis]